MNRFAYTTTATNSPIHNPFTREIKTEIFFHNETIVVKVLPSNKYQGPVPKSQKELTFLQDLVLNTKNTYKWDEGYCKLLFEMKHNFRTDTNTLSCLFCCDGLRKPNTYTETDDMYDDPVRPGKEYAFCPCNDQN